MNILNAASSCTCGNFSATGKILQEQLSDGNACACGQEWREKRKALSQNALSHMWYAEISEYPD